MISGFNDIQKPRKLVAFSCFMHHNNAPKMRA
jgi:hypothetical protein